MKHFDFQSVFPNEKLERPVYAELSGPLVTNEKRNMVVTKLQSGLYGLKEASKIWFSLIWEKFANAELKKMQSTPCVFQNDGIEAVC